MTPNTSPPRTFAYVLLESPLGLGGMLGLQFGVVLWVMGVVPAHLLVIAGWITLGFAAFVALRSVGLPHYLFACFWSAFVYGGLGMIAGHQLDVLLNPAETMAAMRSVSLIAIFVNWMTLTMLLCCMGACYFAEHCRHDPRRTSLRATTHVVAILCMLLGVYAGHMVNLWLNEGLLERFYLQTTAMSLFYMLGYGLGSRATYSIGLHAKQNPGKPGF